MKSFITRMGHSYKVVGEGPKAGVVFYRLEDDGECQAGYITSAKRLAKGGGNGVCKMVKSCDGVWSVSFSTK